jgi:TP901 family phage tail tape measure protein
MTKVGVIGQVAAKDMSSLNTVMLKISNSSEFASTKLAEASLELVKAGIKGAQATKVLGDVSNLATASQADLTEAMMATISTTKAFNLAMDDSNRVVNVMQGAISGSTIGFEDFVEAMKYVAPIAASMGMSIEEASVLIAKLGDMGLKGSIAGTTLKNALLNLLAPGDSVNNVLKKFEGRSMTLTEVLIALQEEGVSMADILETMQMRAITGAVGIGQYGVATKDTADSIQAFIERLRMQGDVVKEAADKIREGSLLNQLTQLGNAFINIFTVMSTSLEGTGAIEGIEKLKKGLIDIQDYLTNNPEVVIKFINNVSDLAYVLGKVLVTALKFTVEHLQEIEIVLGAIVATKFLAGIKALVDMYGLLGPAATAAKLGLAGVTAPLLAIAAAGTSAYIVLDQLTAAMERTAKRSEELASKAGLQAKIDFTLAMKTEGSLLSALEKRELLLNRIAETEKFAKKQDPYAHKLGMSAGEAGQATEYRRLMEDKKELAELDKQAQKVLEKNVALIKEQTGIDVGPYFQNFNASLMDWTKLNAQLNKELEAFDKVSKDLKTTPAASNLDLGKPKPKGTGSGSGGSSMSLLTPDVGESLKQMEEWTRDIFAAGRTQTELLGTKLGRAYVEGYVDQLGSSVSLVSEALKMMTDAPIADIIPEFKMNKTLSSGTSNDTSQILSTGGSLDMTMNLSQMGEMVDRQKVLAELSEFNIKKVGEHVQETQEGIQALQEYSEEYMVSAMEYTKEYYIGQGEAFLEATQMGIDMLTTLNEAAMQKAEKRHNKEMANLARQRDFSVAMAGESATKRAIIESDFRKMESQLLKEKENEEAEYNRKQKAYAIINAIINTALAVTKALSSVSPPASYVLAAMSGAMGAVQIATIASQNYRTGGMIDGQGNSTSDSIPIMASRGEYMLNSGTVDAVGGELGVQQMIDSYLGNAPKPGRSYTVYVENAYGHKEFVRELAKELAVEEDRW